MITDTQIAWFFVAVAVAVVTLCAVEVLRRARRVARKAAQLRQTQAEIETARKETPRQTFRVSPVNRHRARRTPPQNWRNN